MHNNAQLRPAQWKLTAWKRDEIEVMQVIDTYDMCSIYIYSYIIVYSHPQIDAKVNPY